jgi:PASTA domain
VTSTPDTQYTITDNVHHFLVDYAPETVMISPTCGGSRRFLLHVVVSWAGGNPVKIDSSSVFGFRSATNANVIVRRVVPTTTVSNVIGVDQGSVAGHLAGSGLTMGTVTRVVNPVRAGIVIAKNSPAWTIESTGSPVDLTISLGAVTVPDLVGDTSAQATSALAAAGLVAHIEHTAQCLDPGHVIDQTPSAGTSVAPGSTVTITIDSRPSGTGERGAGPVGGEHVRAAIAPSRAGRRARVGERARSHSLCPACRGLSRKPQADASRGRLGPEDPRRSGRGP